MDNGMAMQEMREQTILLLFNRTKKIAEESKPDVQMEVMIARNIKQIGRMINEMDMILHGEIY